MLMTFSAMEQDGGDVVVIGPEDPAPPKVTEPKQDPRVKPVSIVCK